MGFPSAPHIVYVNYGADGGLATHATYRQTAAIPSWTHQHWKLEKLKRSMICILLVVRSITTRPAWIL